MTPRVEIRRALPADASHLVEFNIAMARETEAKDLCKETVARGVRGMLQNPDHGFYLVATRGGERAGALMVTREWSDWRNALFWWIQSVYVRPDQRGQGIYRALYTRVVALARAESGVCGLRLYVEKDNGNAQKVYRSLGMKDSGYLVFEELL